MENELGQWLQHAKDDMDSALFLQKMYPKPLEIICFHLQQSVEKYLKAFLFIHDIEPPKIHDLIELCNMCSAIDSAFATILPFCAYLSPFGVQPRYPSELIINEAILAHAVTCAQKVESFPPIVALK